MALATRAITSKTGGTPSRIQKARRISASGQATIQATAVRVSRWRGRVVAALPRRPKAPSQGADTSQATTNGAAVATILPQAAVSWCWAWPARANNRKARMSPTISTATRPNRGASAGRAGGVAVDVVDLLSMVASLKRDVD